MQIEALEFSIVFDSEVEHRRRRYRHLSRYRGELFLLKWLRWVWGARDLGILILGMYIVLALGKLTPLLAIRVFQVMNREMYPSRCLRRVAGQVHLIEINRAVGV